MVDGSSKDVSFPSINHKRSTILNAGGPESSGVS